MEIADDKRCKSTIILLNIQGSIFKTATFMIEFIDFLEIELKQKVHTLYV